MKKLLFFASAVAMLASCSQDLTKDVIAPAPSFEGNSTIIASFNVGDETRTSLGEAQKNNNKWSKSYNWNEADAMGVFAAEEDDDTNATFKYQMTDEATKKAIFKGPFEFVEGDEYFVYYPYNPAGYNGEATKVLKNNKIRLGIPATQLFNFDAYRDDKGEQDRGSFAQNTAPGIGTGVASVDEDGNKILTVDLTGVASYVYLPIKGTGKVKKLELSLSKTHLNGYTQVSVEDRVFAAPTTNGTTAITLNCGTGVELNPEEATNFWFVIPVLNITEGETLTIKVNDENYDGLSRSGFAPKLDPNKYYAIGDADGDDWYVDVIADDDDDFVIDNEYKFLEYAYAATVATMPEGVTIPDVMQNSGELKVAKIVTDLNFSNFTFAAEGSAFRKAVAAWYTATDGVIPTIGGAKKFIIKGDKKKTDAPVVAAEAEETETPATPADPEAVIISGLKVAGPVFNDGYNATAALKQANHVENIVLKDIVVNTESASVLANRVFDNTTITFTGVVVEGTYTAPLFGTVYTSSLPTDGVERPAGMLFANMLYVNSATVDFTTEKFSVIDYNSIHTHDGGKGAIMYVATASDAATLINEKVKVDKAEQWYSVIAGETSYWTGTKGTKDDDYFTAEEFAYYAKEGNAYELTNNIDLMGKEWTATAATATVTVKEGADVTISNAVVKSAFLLATTGTAKGVTVDSTVKYEPAATEKYVGGLFYEAYAETAAGTTGCAVNAAAPAGVKYGSYYAKIKIELTGTDATMELDGSTVTSAEGVLPYGVFEVAAKEDAQLTENGKTTIRIKGEEITKEVLEAFAKRVEWKYSENLVDGYTLFIYNDANTYVPVKYVLADNVNDKESLEAFIRAQAKTGKDTVNVPAGTYGTPAIAEGVTSIVGAKDENGNPATVFDGAFTNANGVEISNVKFTYTEAENEPKHTHSSGKTWYKAIMDGVEVKGNYTNCVFEGYSAIYNCTLSENVTFTGCKFIANEYNNSWALNFNLAPGANNVVAKFVNCDIDGWFGLGTLNPENDVYAYVFENCTIKVNENSKRGGGNFYCNTSFDECTFIGFPTATTISKATNGQWLAMQDEGYAPFTLNFNKCKIGEEENPLTVLSLMNNKEIVFYNEDSTNRVIVDGAEYNFINKYDPSKYTK